MGQIKEYKCPNCGGAVEFDSVSQKVKCPYCDTEFSIEVFNELNELESQSVISSDEAAWDISAGSEWDSAEEDKIKVYSCNACGGEIIADEKTAALKCPYCDNPVVFTGKLSGALKPDCIIPFKLNKADAKKRLLEHLKGKPFLPAVFTDQNHIDEIKGVYVPFWLFDGHAEGEVHYRAQKTHVWADSKYEYHETSFFKLFRAGAMTFANIPVDGSTSMPQNLMESIEPFNYSDAVDFETAYLAGYLADKYDITAEDSIDRANERIKRSLEENLRKTVSGYENINVEENHIQIQNGKTKYALLPVWVLNTSWNGEKYLFAMNGQTGKFVGNLPVDNSIYWKNFGKTAAIASAAMFIFINIISRIL